MNYSEGSRWRKWDLHVHTPDSIVQNYSGTKEEQWDRFIEELAALPDEFKVVGINDYIFLDGYRKVLEARENGRLANLDLILPVVELRLDKFGGNDQYFSKVNCHIIFSDELTPDEIQHQFLNALPNKYKLTPEARDVAGTWQALPTRESLADLGQKIIDSIPADKRSGSPRPLHLGFSNINFRIADVREALQNHYLNGKHLVAVGKAEWADIRWTDQLIAEKKDIINGANLVFTAAATPEACERGRAKLREEGVNDRLLDCSDAHHFTDSTEKDRIGNCFTWIKADTTFEGLKQALREYEGRVYMGEEPPKLATVRAEGGRFLKSIEVRKKGGSSLEEKWFDCTIPLHSDLVAIIGRKGSGKSAITDVIGLLSDSRRELEFSFLNPKRFRLRKENRARHFEATLTFQNGTTTTKCLDDHIDQTSPQRVNYIPQNYFERLCGDIASGGDTGFQNEIEDVIFSRLDEGARLGQRTLRDVISYRTQEIQDAADLLRGDLEAINKQVATIERQLRPEFEEEISKKLKQRRQDLADHDGGKPEEEPKPELPDEGAEESAENAELVEKKKELEAAEAATKAAETQSVENAKKIAAVLKIEASLKNLKDRYRREGESISDELQLLGLKWEDIVKLAIDEEQVATVKKSLEEDRDSIDRSLASDGEDSLRVRQKTLSEEVAALRSKLDEPQRKYQAYLEAVKGWEEKRASIVGDKETPGTIADLEAAQKRLADLPKELEDLEQKRQTVSGEIYDKLVEAIDLYRDLYRPVQDFVDGNTSVQDKLGLTFEVFLKNSEFEAGFLDRIRRNVRGSFSGPDGPAILKTLTDETDFDDRESTLAFLEKVSAYLHRENGDPDGEEFVVANQVRERVDPEDLYQYLYSMDYLRPQYTLAMSEKSLSSLSPGERGALLLIFYLLVDEDNVPVVLDQPDENLDNETVFDLLVPCIREAKRHRQVIVVTHNPNIAVVCDADQVVHASIDKSDGFEVSYETGAIESPVMNKHLLDVLEGTRPAFDDRDDKYLS